eukprot:PITA_05682
MTNPPTQAEHSPRIGISSVLKALLYSLLLIHSHLTWRINDGSKAHIGVDPWTGGGGRCYIPRDLIRLLNQQNIRVTAQIADQENSSIFTQAWISAAQLNLPLVWHQNWEDYTSALSESHIRIKDGPNELMWNQDESGYYSPKEGYLCLINCKKTEITQSCWKIIWQLKTPPRIKLFFLCILQNKVPTRESLMHRSVHGPTWCILCKQQSESTTHLFLTCGTKTQIWKDVAKEIGFVGAWEGENITVAWQAWNRAHYGTNRTCLPLIICWAIWLATNKMIFKNGSI